MSGIFPPAWIGFSMLNIQAEGSWGRPVFSKKRSGFVPVFTAKGQTCQPDQNPPAFPLTGSSFQSFRSSRKHFTGKKEKYPSSAAAAKKMFMNAAGRHPLSMEFRFPINF
jgi:hypothetical protein